MKNKLLISALSASALFFILFLSIYYYNRYDLLIKKRVHEISIDVMQQLDYTQREYQNLYAQSITTLKLIEQGKTLEQYISQPDKSNKNKLIHLWKMISGNKKWYSRLVFVNESGQEKVAVNYIHPVDKANEPRTWQQEFLRRDYPNLYKLKSDASIILGIRRTLGSKKLELRIIQAVDLHGERKGYLVLDFNVPYVISQFHGLLAHYYNLDLLSQDGRYLTGSESGRLFTDSSLQFTSPYILQIWRHIQQNQSGYDYACHSLVAYAPIQVNGQVPFYMLVNIDKQQLNQLLTKDIRNLYSEAFFVVCLMMFFAIPVVSLALYYRRRSFESKLANAALNGMTAVMISDKYYRVIMVNSQFEQLFGYSSSQVIGRNMYKILTINQGKEEMKRLWHQFDEQGVWEGEVCCRNNYQKNMTFIIRIQAIQNASGRRTHYVTSLINISKRKQLEERLRTLSERDAMTQLWNRRKFEEKLLQQVDLVERYADEAKSCLALIDIDYFKKINDQKGHAEGDKMICSVADTLSCGVRETDFVARVGGEEFAIIMPQTELQEAHVVMERLRQQIEQHPSITVTISAGISQIGNDMSKSYKCADLALYQSKTLGRNHVSLCTNMEDIT